MVAPRPWPTWSESVEPVLPTSLIGSPTPGAPSRLTTKVRSASWSAQKCRASRAARSPSSPRSSSRHRRVTRRCGECTKLESRHAPRGGLGAITMLREVTLTHLFVRHAPGGRDTLPHLFDGDRSDLFYQPDSSRLRGLRHDDRDGASCQSGHVRRLPYIPVSCDCLSSIPDMLACLFPSAVPWTMMDAWNRGHRS